MNRFLLPLLGFIVLVAFLGVGLTLKPRELPSALLHKPAPLFSVPTLAEQDFTSTQMHGDVWLLNVWASWCVACRTEHPLLNELARADVLPIVGLNYKDAAADATDWLRRLGNPYAHIPVDSSGDVGIEYGVYGVPETYLIDPKGVIRFKQVGPLTPETMGRMRPLIAKLREETR